MIGHEPLLKLRMQGFSPSVVFVNETIVGTDWFEHGDFATVCILPDEPLELLDLRFCMGLVVSTGSTSENRAKRLLEAFKSAGAQAVAATHCYPIEGKTFYKTGWSEIWSK
jgi:hypothetical protein